jgi:hypothetical protein
MTRPAKSVRVRLFINRMEVDWKDLTPRELEAIVREIRKMWPPDMRSRVWFDVEVYNFDNYNRYDASVWVVCYHMPIHDKSQTAYIPQAYIDGLVGEEFRIFPVRDPQDDDGLRKTVPFRGIEMQLVEVLYVLE